jgi:hypothetical protein
MEKIERKKVFPDWKTIHSNCYRDYKKLPDTDIIWGINQFNENECELQRQAI